MNYTLVILGVILLIVIYILYKVISEKGKVVSKKVDLSETNSPVSYSDLNSPNAARFCFSGWAYVESFTSAPMTLVRVDTSSGGNTFFQLDVASGPTLNYTILTSSTDNGDVAVTKEIMPNFPLQKWVCIMVSFDNKVVDLYIDGKLVRSQQLDSSPTATNKDHVIMFPKDSNNNKGYLAKFERLTSPMDPATAWNKYMEGNGGNYFSRLLSQYGASLTLKKDDLDLRQFTLF